MGLYLLDEFTIPLDVLGQFKPGEIEDCSNFVFPDALKQQPFECYMATTLSGPFQTVFRCARVEEIQVYLNS